MKEGCYKQIKHLNVDAFSNAYYLSLVENMELTLGYCIYVAGNLVI